jgi:hypothetical protein
VAVLLKRHVLDDGGELAMVANQNDAFEAADVALLLQQKRNERLDLEDLAAFFHHNGVKLKPLLKELVALQCQQRRFKFDLERGVSASHSDNFGLCRHQIVAALVESPETSTLIKDITNLKISNARYSARVVNMHLMWL